MDVADEMALVKRAHIALATTCSRKRTASILGISKIRLDHLIVKYPELGSYSAEAQPASQLEVWSKKPAPTAPKPSEEEVSLAITKANTQLREGFAELGVTGESLDKAIACARFGENHFSAIENYTSGGLVVLFANLLVDYEEARQDIHFVGDDYEMQRVLREDRTNLAKLILATHAMVREAGVAKAVIEAKKREAREKKVKGRTAFAPLQAPSVAVKVEGNMVVNRGTNEATQD